MITGSKQKVNSFVLALMENYELHGIKLEFIQGISSQTNTIIGEQSTFMAWASSNQHLKFPLAEILTTKPDEIDFFPLIF